MAHADKKRLFLLGLDDRLLWQLTRTLATVEEDIEYVSATSLSDAEGLLRDQDMDLLVVDGADEAVAVLRSLASANARGALPRMLVLTEQSFQSLPQEMLLPDDTLFLEKPFNPKEFPFFVIKAIEEYAPPSEAPPRPSEAPPGYTPPPEAPLPRSSEAIEESAPAFEPGPVPQEEGRVETQEERNVEAVADFFHYFDEGFSCLARQDLCGARENWVRALALKPADKRVQANLARLEKMIKR